MEGYTLSVNFLKQAKQLKMASPEYKIYADLRAAGNAMRDSWAIAFQGYGFNWPKDTLEREMNKLESLESVQKRIAEVQGKKAKNENSDELTQEELIKATSKEEILRNLVIAQRKQKFGSPEWQKTTAMIADYSKIKQDEIDTESTTCHFYLPVDYPSDCQSCLIFKNGKAICQSLSKG